MDVMTRLPSTKLGWYNLLGTIPETANHNAINHHLDSEASSDRRKALNTTVAMVSFDQEARPSMAECYKLP